MIQNIKNHFFNFCLAFVILSFSVRAQDEFKPNIYGFTSAKFAHYSENREPAIGNGNINNTFSMFQSNIFLSGNVSDDWKYLLELMIQNNLTEQQNDGQNLLHQAWLEWKPADEYSIRAGRMLAPFGYFNMIHSRPNLYWFIERPFAYEEPALSDGVSGVRLEFANLAVLGKLNLLESVNMEYAVYAGNTGNTIQYDWDLNSRKTVGGRLGFIHDNFNLGFSVGNNVIEPTDDELIQTNANMIAVDLNFNYLGFNLIGEYINSSIQNEERDNATSNNFTKKGDEMHHTSMFVTLGYNISDDFLVYGAYDSFQNHEGGQFSDTPLTRIRGGLNFKPNNNVIIKTEFNNYPYKENNRLAYNSINFGAVLTF